MEGIVIERAGTTKRDEYGHAAVSQSTRSQALREPRRSATRVTPMVPQLREGVAPQIDGGARSGSYGAVALATGYP